MALLISHGSPISLLEVALDSPVARKKARISMKIWCTESRKSRHQLPPNYWSRHWCCILKPLPPFLLHSRHDLVTFSGVWLSLSYPRLTPILGVLMAYGSCKVKQRPRMYLPSNGKSWHCVMLHFKESREMGKMCRSTGFPGMELFLLQSCISK